MFKCILTVSTAVMGVTSQSRLRGDGKDCESGKDCKLSRKAEVHNIIEQLKKEKVDRQFASFISRLVDQMAVSQSSVLALQSSDVKKQAITFMHEDSRRRLANKSLKNDIVCDLNCDADTVCRSYGEDETNSSCYSIPSDCINNLDFEVWLHIAYTHVPSCDSIAAFGPNKAACALKVNDWYSASIRQANPSLRKIDGHLDLFKDQYVADLCPVSCGVCSRV